MKKLISGIIAVAMALSLAACQKETKVISLSGKTMGIRLSLTADMTADEVRQFAVHL